jgi:hybrid cluster-associated redox disulfide protein
MPQDKAKIPKVKIKPASKKKSAAKKTVPHFNAKTMLGEILYIKPAASEVIVKYFGRMCFGCPSHSFESLEQAAAVHGQDLKKILRDLNAL